MVATQSWTQKTSVFVGVLIFNICLSNGADAIRNLCLERAGQQLATELRMAAYNHLQSQSAEYFFKERTGDLQSRLVSDVDQLNSLVLQGTDSVLSDGLMVLGVLIVFVCVHPVLGFLSWSPMLVSFLLLSKYNKSVKPAYREARKQVGKLGAKLTDNLGGIRLIQSFGAEAVESQKIKDLATFVMNENLKAVLQRARFMPWVKIAASFNNVIILAGGCYYYLQGQLTLGNIVTLRGYGRYFNRPVDSLAGTADMLSRASAAAARLFEVLDAPITVADPAHPVELKVSLTGALSLREVSFAYNPKNSNNTQLTSDRNTISNTTSHNTPAGGLPLSIDEKCEDDDNAILADRKSLMAAEGAGLLGKGPSSSESTITESNVLEMVTVQKRSQKNLFPPPAKVGANNSDSDGAWRGVGSESVAIEKITKKDNARSGSGSHGPNKRSGMPVELSPPRWVLHQVTLSIPAGQRVAIVGPSGAGKSTLLGLLARNFDPTRGVVELDGVDLRCLRLAELRAATTVVSQDPFVFNDSIRNNLVLGCTRVVSEVELSMACTNANCLDFVSALPQGFDTVVGERGVMLSGGQRQRLSLARAFLADPKLLLLDEPTSAVEPASEVAIVLAIRRLMEGRTTVIVSHRLSLARASHRVLVVEHGRITEDGPPAALLANSKSKFAAMWRADRAFAEGGDSSNIIQGGGVANDEFLANLSVELRVEDGVC